MPGKRGVARGSRLPLPVGHWWWSWADHALLQLDKTRRGWRDITRALRELPRGGIAVSEDAVRRVFEDRILTWEIVTPLSTVLGIPPPGVIFDEPEAAMKVAAPTPELAVAFDTLRKLGLSVAPRGQGAPVVSKDEPEHGRDGDAVKRGRRK
jgi:hypothetical protein